MTVLLIDNYDSFTYNLYQMVQAQTEQPVVVYRNDALDWEAVQNLRPRQVILSPGPGHPGTERDFGICREIILHHNQLDCPVLGVCLGHQGLVHHLGGEVLPAPAVVHGKTSPVRVLKPDPLLEGLPNPFTAMRYHSWVVSRNLPPMLDILAETEDTDRLVMAIRHKHRPLYGVQFHPESIGTPQGARLLGNFLGLKATLQV